MRTMLAVATATLICAQPASAGIDPLAAKPQVETLIDAAYPRLEATYRDLHQHPELGFQETRSAALLAKHMRKLGFKVTEQVGKTGIVAEYRNGPGPRILVRTDLDGLPVKELTGLPYASRSRQMLDGKEVDVSHACGHDMHMTWWLGAAETLVAMKGQWRGTLLFVAQPAEEVLSGAKAMLADGLVERFGKPDYAFGAHVMGSVPAGTILIKDGTVMTAADAIDITFNGRGAHGSIPSASIDPVMMGASFAMNVQTVISRRKDANAFGVITIGSFQAGLAGNVIPEKADLKLSLRSLTPEVRQLLVDGVESTAREVSAMAGAQPPTIVRRYGTSAMVNDSQLAARMTPLLRSAYGDRFVALPANAPALPSSEDFSEFGQLGIASLYILIGGDDPAKLAENKAHQISDPINHSPYYAPTPDPTIRIGAAVLTLAVLAVAS